MTFDWRRRRMKVTVRYFVLDATIRSLPPSQRASAGCRVSYGPANPCTNNATLDQLFLLHPAAKTTSFLNN